MRAFSTPRRPRVARRLSGAALSVAVVGITATTVTTAFAAGDDGAIRVAPGTARPGGTVTLSTDACGPGGSAGVDASALGAGILGLEPRDAEARTAKGKLRVTRDTKPGRYALGGSCTDGRELAGTVVVGPAKPAAGDAEHRAGERQPATGSAEAKAGDEWPEGEDWKEWSDEGAPEDGAPKGSGAGDSWPEGEDWKEWPGDGGDPFDKNGDRGKGGHHGDDWGKHGRDGKDGHDDRQDWRHDRHGKMPHGRVHTGVGGAGAGVDSAMLTGGSLALVAAAGGALYLRRRHRRLDG
ncbi:hypothetical protein RM572_13540 [Streptomyces sp. DSM 42041]|uniref:Gram-positive cocci surface proteins LPxTG domain-containing protein n=1 Tax=Streptomyces hazeniae TaxID=3075538 RepID=A0ABU2NS22_9ACTN|nr:hypothetical protein [Streptomyces sp. DSM 42041]MDT0379783.1 hypothetical protein [Streptomyces sp. DSM 42041]